MSQHLQIARMLMRHSRYDAAEKELGEALAESPEDADVYQALAQCLQARGQLDKALLAARKAIELAPQDPFSHFVLSSCFFSMQDWKPAEAAARSALELDPFEPDYFQQLAAILFNRQQWQAAFAAADEGLALDPEHAGCLNVRSRALTKLGRHEEAVRTTEGVLSRDPENPESHSTQGWTYLHQNDPKKALEHFAEALRLDPENGSAREGMVYALKARYWFYRILLQFFLWMARKQAKYRWAFVIGLFVTQQSLSSIAKRYPESGPVVWTLFALIAAFCVASWLADPLFNLLLRLNKFGRHAVKPDDRACALWVGGFLVGGLVVLGWAAVEQSLTIALISAFFVIDTILVCAVYRFVTRPRRVVALVAAVLTIGAEAVTAYYMLETVLLGDMLDDAALRFNRELAVKKMLPEGSPELAESKKRLSEFDIHYNRIQMAYRESLEVQDTSFYFVVVPFFGLMILSQVAPGRRYLHLRE